MGPVVFGLVILAFGLVLALNLWGSADRAAAYGASRPDPPPGARGYVRDPSQVRLIGAVFAAIGAMAVLVTLGVIPNR